MLQIQSDNVCVHQMAHTLEAHQVHQVHLDHLVNLEEMDMTLDQLMWASTLQNIYRVRENLSIDILCKRSNVTVFKTELPLPIAGDVRQYLTGPPGPPGPPGVPGNVGDELVDDVANRVLNYIQSKNHNIVTPAVNKNDALHI